MAVAACLHLSWDIDEDGTLYCCVCDKNMSPVGKFKRNEEG